MDIGGKTRDAAEDKTYVLELEKRLGDVESALQNISRGFQSGNFAPEQEGRLAMVEERLENVEDLQMVANLDLIKMRDAIEKVPVAIAQPSFIAGANTSGLERRVNDMESALRRFGDSSQVELQKAGVAQPVAGKQDMQVIRNEISQMKNEFSSFKGETEEVIKAMISSIKRLSEVLK